MKTNSFFSSCMGLLVALFFSSNALASSIEVADAPACSGVTISTSGDAITIDGASGYHHKLYNITTGSWVLEWECINNCGSSYTIDDLSDGTYKVNVWNVGWSLICDENTVVSSGGTFNCNEVSGTYGSGQISINGGSGYHYKVYDISSGAWVLKSQCINNCPATHTVSGLGSGTYKINVWNVGWSLRCDENVVLSSSSRLFNGDNTLSEADADKYSVKLYPNPANKSLQIGLGDFAQVEGQMSIYNPLGQRVMQKDLEGSQTELTIELSSFENGFYYLVLEAGKIVTTKHFVVER